METRQLSYEKEGDTAIEVAAELLQAGKLVAMPTETVYGLGADARNSEAIQNIYKAKGRPSDNPLIVHLASKEQLLDYVKPYQTYVDALIDKFSPGPITYVLKCQDNLAKEVTASLDTVGIRFPSHPVAHALLKVAKIPVAAPSANLSGKPSPTCAKHVAEDLSGRIDAILDGGASEVGLESTVIDCTGPHPVILRQGKISKKDIETVISLGEKSVDEVVQPKSPGVKYKHYEPEVPLILVRTDKQLIELIEKERKKGQRVGALVTATMSDEIEADKLYILGDSEAMYARQLYRELRAMKKEEVDLVIAKYVTDETIGLAVMDRLKRAAAKIYD